MTPGIERLSPSDGEPQSDLSSQGLRKNNGHSSVEIVRADDCMGRGCVTFDAVSSSRALRRVKSQ
jgi:hypothetical protein